jgi:hypothetical protein
MSIILIPGVWTTFQIEHVTLEIFFAVQEKVTYRRLVDKDT